MEKIAKLRQISVGALIFLIDAEAPNPEAPTQSAHIACSPRRIAIFLVGYWNAILVAFNDNLKSRYPETSPNGRGASMCVFV